MFFVAAVISTERNRQYYIQSDLRISALNSARLRWHIPAPHRQPQSSALHSAGSDGKQPGSRRCSERGAAEPRAGGAAAPSAGALLSVPAAVRGAVERTISAGRPALGGRTGEEPLRTGRAEARRFVQRHAGLRGGDRFPGQVGPLPAPRLFSAQRQHHPQRLQRDVGRVSGRYPRAPLRCAARSQPERGVAERQHPAGAARRGHGAEPLPPLPPGRARQPVGAGAAARFRRAAGGAGAGAVPGRLGVQPRRVPLHHRHRGEGGGRASNRACPAPRAVRLVWWVPAQCRPEPSTCRTRVCQSCIPAAPEQELPAGHAVRTVLPQTVCGSQPCSPGLLSVALSAPAFKSGVLHLV